MIQPITNIQEMVSQNEGIVLFGHTINPDLSQSIQDLNIPQITNIVLSLFSSGKIRTGRCYPLMYNQKTAFFCTYAYKEEDNPHISHFDKAIEGLISLVPALNIMRLGVLVPDNAELDREAVMTKLSTLERKIPLTLIRFYEEDTGALL